MKLEILYEDNHLLVVNKPSGIPSQNDLTEDKSIIDYAKEYLKERYNKPGNVYIGLPHRIDRPVSGALLLTKTSKAHERMARQFNEHKVKKIYLAIVDKFPEAQQGTLHHWIVKDSKTNKSKAYKKPVKFGKEAILNYEVLGASENYTLMLIELLTGRHHQIRAQLKAMGLHIRGDVKYGAKRPLPGGAIDLHSFILEFEHPVKKENLKILAPPPQHQLWDFFMPIIKKHMEF